MTKTITYQGRPTDGEVMDFEVQAEPWCEYLLKDGTRVRIKLVTKEILKLVGEYYQNNGEPMYLVLSENIITQAVPDTVKQPVLRLVDPPPTVN